MKNKFTIIIVIILSILAMGLLGWVIGNSIKKEGFTPRVTEILKSSEPQRIWGDAPGDTFVPTPLLQDEYVTLYKKAVKSIKDRDFETFSKTVSYQRLWRLKYRMLEFGPIEDGVPTVKVEKSDQEQVFYDFLISNMLNFSPDFDQVYVESMEVNDNNNDLELDKPTKYFNTEQGIDMLVYKNGYNHTVTLLCHAVGSDYFTKGGSGKIVFVFDNGEWRFDWQYWIDENVPFEDMNRGKNFGDINDVNTEIVFDSTSGINRQNFDLGEVTIQRGQTVKWKDAEGTVQSFMQSPGDLNWSSPFMNLGNYFKNFDKVGIYPYQIIYADSIFNGKIIVE